MKHKTHHLHYLFYPRSWVMLIALLLFGETSPAQEQSTPKEIVLDGFMGYESLFIDSIYNSYVDYGFNTMTQQATNASKSLLDSFDLHAVNMKDSVNNPNGSMDWIYYYSSGYYSKWEAEEDQPRWDRVGVKHSDGETSYLYDPELNDSVLCWSTKGVNEPVDTLVYGPTYYQEKFYKRWLYTDYPIYEKLSYTPRFRMALQKHDTIPDTQDVCRIYVLLKYRKFENDTAHHADSTYILKEPVTLKVSDFPSNGNFGYIYFSNFVEQRPYKYPSWFWPPITADLYKMMPSQIEGTYYEDKWGGTGVQFCIDWLISDSLCTLYIDNIEVYDNDGWNKYIINPEEVADKIKYYALNFSNWNNIKYWMGGHEPTSIDAYTPIKIVDDILQSPPLNAPPLMNTIWALWNQDLNGESQLARYYNTVQPNKLLVEFHPIQSGHDPPKAFGYEVLRRILQESYSLTQEKKFYYHVQSYGQFKDNGWYYFRRPSVPEYKPTVMLALSHGADGLVQARYDSAPYDPNSPYFGILGIIGLESDDYEKSDLWYELKNNLIPRLKGMLGKTLMTLNYTGDYLYLGRNLQEDPGNGFTNSAASVNEQYLTLTEYTGDSTPPPTHFHVGFFSRPNHPFDNYFMLDNLITTNDKTVTATLEPPIAGFANYRFKNVEGLFDTTFNENGIVKLLTHPAGEGYLYQVAPVIKYGGKLIYDETISRTTTLLDDMSIEDDAVLTVNNTYNVDRTITIKDNGSIITTFGGTMKFYNNLSLVVEGSVTISGTPQNKLVLDFLNPSERNGIIIKPGGSLTISYCEIKNAGTGIFSELNADSLIVEYVDFIDCEDNSISIAGRSGEENVPININNCTIENSECGISVNNTSSILIRWNQITDTDCGIRLSNVSDALIVCNNIGSVMKNFKEYYL